MLSLVVHNIIFSCIQYLAQKNTNLTNRNTYKNANESTGYAEWDPSNVNDDFNAPYKHDYALFPSDNTASGTSAGVKLQTLGLGTNTFQSFK